MILLTAVPQSDCKRPAGRPHASWMATMKNDLSYHNLSVEAGTKLALDRLLRRLLAASGATYWNGASRTMMMITNRSAAAKTTWTDSYWCKTVVTCHPVSCS